MNKENKLFWILLILFSSKEIRIASVQDNPFSLILVNENIGHGNYIRSTKSEDGYLYLVTGEDFDSSRYPNRFILKFEISSAKLLDTISYHSSYRFMRGEPYSILNNYLYMTSFIDENSYTSGAYEIFDLGTKTEIDKNEDTAIHGYRRVFLKANNNYYYSANIINWRNLLVKKLEVKTNSNNKPYFQEIALNSNVEIRYSGMITCALTNNKNKIICAYFNTDLKVSISVYGDFNFVLYNGAIFIL